MNPNLSSAQFDSPPWTEHPERRMGHGVVANGPKCAGPGCNAKRTRHSPFCSKCKTFANAEFVHEAPAWDPATHSGPTRGFPQTKTRIPKGWA